MRPLTPIPPPITVTDADLRRVKRERERYHTYRLKPKAWAKFQGKKQ